LIKDRGKGIEVKIKYKYIEQPNGRFTILDVPIFSAFSREKEDGSIVKAEIKDLKKAIQLFNLRKEKGYYPTIHRLHQDLESNEEREHLGYLDNLNLKDGLVYGDLVEISEETINEIKNYKLGNRSPEYIPDEPEIVSLALLESKPPHNKFPLLVLEDSPTFLEKESINFMFQGRIEQFNERSKNMAKKKDQGCKADAIQLEEEYEDLEETIEDEENKEQFADEDIAADPQNVKDEEDSMQEDIAIDKQIVTILKKQGVILENIAAGCERLGKFLDVMESEDEYEGEEDEEQLSEDIEEEDLENEEEDEEMEDKKLSSDKASSVALSQQFKYMNKAILQLNDELKDIKKERKINQFNQQLRSLCDANPSISFSAEKRHMEQLSDSRSKMAHLNYLKTNAERFSANGTPRRIAGSVNIEQFSNESPRVQAVARQAKIDYRDSVNQRDIAAAQQFKQTWKSEKSYVEKMVQLAKASK